MVKIEIMQKRLAIFLMVLSCFSFLGSIYSMLFNSQFNDQSIVTYFGIIIGILSVCIFVTSYLIHEGSVFFLQVLQSVLIMLSVVAIAIALIIPAAWIGYIIGILSAVSLALSYWKGQSGK